MNSQAAAILSENARVTYEKIEDGELTPIIGRLTAEVFSRITKRDDVKVLPMTGLTNEIGMRARPMKMQTSFRKGMDYAAELPKMADAIAKEFDAIIDNFVSKSHLSRTGEAIFAPYVLFVEASRGDKIGLVTQFGWR